MQRAKLLQMLIKGRGYSVRRGGHSQASEIYLERHHAVKPGAWHRLKAKELVNASQVNGIEYFCNESVEIAGMLMRFQVRFGTKPGRATGYARVGLGQRSGTVGIILALVSHYDCHPHLPV